MEKGKFLLTVVAFLGVQGLLMAQGQELRLKGEAQKSENNIIADRADNYDVNGNLTAGILLVTSLDDIVIESTLGVVKQTELEEGILVFLSPEERIISISQKGFKPLDVILNNVGIKLAGGEVWQLELEKKEKVAYEEKVQLRVTESLRYLQNEIVANRTDNKSKEGVLAAGLKIYSSLDAVEVNSQSPEKILKVTQEKGYWLVYVIPGLKDLKLTSGKNKSLDIDLSGSSIESGKVYSITVD